MTQELMSFPIYSIVTFHSYVSLSEAMIMCVDTYIYIYTYTHIHTVGESFQRTRNSHLLVTTIYGENNPFHDFGKSLIPHETHRPVSMVP